jgi:hypothetical protein
MMGDKDRIDRCMCFQTPDPYLVLEGERGMDKFYGIVSLWVCSLCGQHWLKYLFELEAFTGSGRWYLGPIMEEQASQVTAHNARAILSGLEMYLYGGSYFGGDIGRSVGPLIGMPAPH